MATSSLFRINSPTASSLDSSTRVRTRACSSALRPCKSASMARPRIEARFETALISSLVFLPLPRWATFF
eukprot:736625-Pleurochrysis_carterae.AAC.1